MYVCALVTVREIAVFVLVCVPWRVLVAVCIWYTEHWLAVCLCVMAASPHMEFDLLPVFNCATKV